MQKKWFIINRNKFKEKTHTFEIENIKTHKKVIELLTGENKDKNIYFKNMDQLRNIKYKRDTRTLILDEKKINDMFRIERKYENFIFNICILCRKKNLSLFLIPYTKLSMIWHYSIGIRQMFTIFTDSKDNVILLYNKNY